MTSAATEAADRDAFYTGKFPDGFAWGTATACYQIEGAWDKDGKGASIWDTFTHEKGHVINEDTGDVACDSYHKYGEDIRIMKELGVSHYRLSLSWSRILPDGTPKSLNAKGVAYYNRVIDGLKAAGIEPMVTLYHWDLPQTLDDHGGWLNPDMAQHFLEYARICFREFGDRVKLWITFNEPAVFIWDGYAIGEGAPGIKDPASAPPKVAHTVIRAHAMTYQAYDKEFRPKQQGKVGITLVVHWCEPKDPSNSADVEACERFLQCILGWYANPVFGDGDYPDVMKKQYAKMAASFGMTKSPLPEFTEEEKALNKGSYDFFGLNHYTTRYVSHIENSAQGEDAPSKPLEKILGLSEEVDPSWKRGASSWLYVVPWGLRRLLKWVKDTYNNPVVYVTENGISDASGTLDDVQRSDYFRLYLNEVLKAIRIDGCDVRGYMAWSLMDNFEWSMGYSERFGLYHVDFNNPERPRTAKASAKYYAQVIKDNGFPA